MSDSLQIRGLNFSYLPAKEDGPRRLLLVMHGLGDSLEGYRFLPGILRIPGLHYLLVNAPDPYFTGYSWFDIYGDMEKGVIRSRGLLFGVLEELERQGWPAAKVGVFGFSQGCLMAMDLACRYPKQFGAVVGVSGYIAFLNEYPEALASVAKEQKILVTHGTDDPMLPLESTRRQVQALKGFGLRIDWKVYQKEHTIDPYEEVADIHSFLIRSFESGEKKGQ